MTASSNPRRVRVRCSSGDATPHLLEFIEGVLAGTDARVDVDIDPKHAQPEPTDAATERAVTQGAIDGLARSAKEFAKEADAEGRPVDAPHAASAERLRELIEDTQTVVAKWLVENWPVAVKVILKVGKALGIIGDPG